MVFFADAAYQETPEGLEWVWRVAFEKKTAWLHLHTYVQRSWGKRSAELHPCTIRMCEWTIDAQADPPPPHFSPPVLDGCFCQFFDFVCVGWHLKRKLPDYTSIPTCNAVEGKEVLSFILDYFFVWQTSKSTTLVGFKLWYCKFRGISGGSSPQKTHSLPKKNTGLEMESEE